MKSAPDRHLKNIRKDVICTATDPSEENNTKVTYLSYLKNSWKGGRAVQKRVGILGSGVLLWYSNPVVVID